MTAKAEALEANTQGRRPTGPGWYWYTGPGQWRGSIDEPVWVSPPYVECRTRHRDEIVGNMPGDFVPLTKPVAAPETDTDVLGVTLDVIPSHDGKQRLLVSSMNERAFSVLATFKSVESAEWFMRFWRVVRTICINDRR